MISRSFTALLLSVQVTACAHNQVPQNCSQRLKFAQAEHDATVTALNEQNDKASKTVDPNEFSKTAARAANLAGKNAALLEIKKQCGIEP